MTEENIQVSQETITKIDNEINKVEDAKIEAAKEEGKQEVAKSVDEMKKELEAVKAANAKIVQEQEAQRIAMELEAEKKKQAELQQAAQHKAIVAQTPNPTTPKEIAPQEVKLTSQQEWEQFNQAVMAGKMRASILDVKDN